MSSSSSFLQKRENLTTKLTWTFISLMILTGIIIRYAGLDFNSIDIYNFLLKWYKDLAAGGFSALRQPFSNYTPPYLYLLFLMTKTAGWIPEIPAIKLPSIFFDFINAILIYQILKIKYPQGSISLIGAAAFLLLPTILWNSAYWGQSDAIYTCFLLAFLYGMMKGQPLLAMICFGVAFSIKAQAVFLGPLVLLLVVRKKIPWFYLALAPIIYVLMMIPAALTGRPWMELLKIYFGQAELYHRLSENAPNLYLLIPSRFYSLGLKVGLLVTGVVALTWTAVYASKVKEFSADNLLLCALVSAAFMPFFLPKMHERYFYVAEVLAYLVAFYFSGGWWLAIGYQLVSGMVYFVVLRESVTRVYPPFAKSLALEAAVLNTVLTGFLFWFQWKWTTRRTE